MQDLLWGTFVVNVMTPQKPVVSFLNRFSNLLHRLLVLYKSLPKIFQDPTKVLHNKLFKHHSNELTDSKVGRKRFILRVLLATTRKTFTPSSPIPKGHNIPGDDPEIQWDIRGWISGHWEERVRGLGARLSPHTPFGHPPTLFATHPGDAVGCRLESVGASVSLHCVTRWADIW